MIGRNDEVLQPIGSLMDKCHYNFHFIYVVIPYVPFDVLYMYFNCYVCILIILCKN